MNTLIKGSLIVILSFLQIIISPIISDRTANANDDIDSIIRRTEERRNAIARMMEESTLFIYVPFRDSFSMGTGFVVADNYILTNAHVTDGNKKIYVAGKNIGLVKAKLVDEVHTNSDDFALLYIDSPVTLPILSFNLNLQRTDRVSAWGYPGLVTQFDESIESLLNGMEFSDIPPVVYTEGTVSSFVSSGGQDSIIHTAAIAGGNSGGPLVNSRGEVVGINTWGATEEGEGAFVNAALHAQAAIKFLRSNGITPIISDGNYVASNYQNSGNSAQAPQRPITPIQLPDDIMENPSSPNSISAATESINNIFSGGNSAQNGIGSSISSITSIAQGMTQGSDEIDVNSSSSNFSSVDEELDFALNSYLGEGAPYDPDRGVKLLQRFVNQGNVDAEIMLGTIYISDPDYQNTQEGMKLLRKAAEEEPYYASILADFLFFGEAYGIEPNTNEALKYAKRGSEADDADAQALLALLYLYGVGGEDKILEAYKLATKAEENGATKAYAALAYIYGNGIGAEINEMKAFNYAKQGADEDDATAMGYLANSYLQGIGTEINYEKAFEWADAGSIESDGVSEYVLGFLYSNGLGVKQNLPLAWAYFDLAVKDLVLEAEDEKNKIYEIMNTEERAEAIEYVKMWRKQWGFNS